ncbi:hypothetical protein B0H16DRAFT_1480502 [Mycena metata]|uniref:Uncharacterized protein n=1 Tax=Mycena metata TaxID=1033252 RepID=A0AAD7H4C5_9AGAR|nr:hypothetical protein B0H16DRAFT_1480502 [Mycena metata]
MNQKINELDLKIIHAGFEPATNFLARVVRSSPWLSFRTNNRDSDPFTRQIIRALFDSFVRIRNLTCTCSIDDPRSTFQSIQMMPCAHTLGLGFPSAHSGDFYSGRYSRSVQPRLQIWASRMLRRNENVNAASISGIWQWVHGIFPLFRVLGKCIVTLKKRNPLFAHHKTFGTRSGEPRPNQQLTTARHQEYKCGHLLLGAARPKLVFSQDLA